jgi:hypothetical protein
LPVGDEIFPGNPAAATTVEDLVRLMEEKHGQPPRIWGLARGMVREDNLEFLRERPARYLVGTPQSQREKFQAQLLEQKDWPEVQAGVEVKLVAHPDGQGGEQSVLCRSRARRQKEAAMIELARQRLRAPWDKLHQSLQRQPAQNAEKVGRRIGRWPGRFPAAEKWSEVIVEHDGQQRACGLKATARAERTQWAAHAHGAYLLRANCVEKDPAQLGRWHRQLPPAEDAFRISKSDLHPRPVFHQKTQRVEAHLLVCFLSLALWRALEQWMRGKHLGPCARQLVKEVATVRSLDVVLPVRDEASQETHPVRLRVVARPDRAVAGRLARLGLEPPGAPKPVQNVAGKNRG